jgi:hypothetical protein
LPEFDLSVPRSDEHQKYLGVTGKTFTIPEIKAEVVIVETDAFFGERRPDCRKVAGQAIRKGAQ